MSGIKKDTNKVARKELKGKKTAHKPDKEKWNTSPRGAWVDISKIEFVNKPK